MSDDSDWTSDEGDYDDFTGDKAIDDPKLMFIIQLRIFNSIDEEKFEKTLRLVYMLDRYLAPYWDRWQTKRAYKGNPATVGYEDRRKKLTEEFRAAAETGSYKGQLMDEDALMRTKTEELFELERMLMREAQLLPARRASEHGGLHG